MADGKKSVLLYCDLITTVEKLKDGDAGKLFKHFLRYVNDLNPKSPNQLIEIVFEPIKQQLKRDLKKWESRSKKNSNNANKRWEEVRKNANASERIKPDAKNADTVNDTVTVTVTDTVNDIYKKIEKEDSVDFEKVFNEIISDVIFQEAVAMQIKLPLVKIQESLFEFLNELKLKDDYHKGVKKIKQHFINWIKIQKEKSFAKKESKADQTLAIANRMATKYANEE